jgi:hypothetical protein
MFGLLQSPLAPANISTYTTMIPSVSSPFMHKYTVNKITIYVGIGKPKRADMIT